MARTPKVVEDRREQIIDAAMVVFAEKGFTRATNKDIARQAGITPGLIYHYFANKEALLMTIVERRSPLSLVRSIPPEMLDRPPEVLLRFMILRLLAIVENETFLRLLRVLIPEIIYNPRMGDFGMKSIQEGLRFLESYLARQQELGMLDLHGIAPSIAAQSFIGGVIGFVVRRQFVRDPFALSYSHEQVADNVLALVLHGIAAH